MRLTLIWSLNFDTREKDKVTFKWFSLNFVEEKNKNMHRMTPFFQSTHAQTKMLHKHILRHASNLFNISIYREKSLQQPNTSTYSATGVQGPERNMIRNMSVNMSHVRRAKHPVGTCVLCKPVETEARAVTGEVQEDSLWDLWYITIRRPSHPMHHLY